MRLHPFRAVRPAPDLAQRVAAVPYDVVSRAEAADLAKGNPYSFLHVGRSDIDLPADVDPYDPRVYAKAREALDRFQAEGTLIRERTPSLYLYRQVMDGRAQTGVVGCVHIDDYEQDIIRKHENTRPDKEDDRTRHVLTLHANAEPVFLTYRDRPEIDQLTETLTRAVPLYDFTAPDGVRHTVWRMAEPGPFLDAFRSVPHAYVADGHHRSASAWRAGRELRNAPAHRRGDGEYNWFLAVLFPAEQLRILPYNRVVRDLAGQSAGDGAGPDGPPGPRHDDGRPDAGQARHLRRLPPELLVPAGAGRGGHRPERSDRITRCVAAAGSRARADARNRRPAHRQADRLRGRHPRPRRAGAPSPLRGDGRRASRSTRRRSTSSWRSPTRAGSCRPRARGSSPSCAAGSSCIPCRLTDRMERRT